MGLLEAFVKLGPEDRILQTLWSKISLLKEVLEGRKCCLPFTVLPWLSVLCLQSFGEMLDIKENDRGSPKRPSLLLFMWKVLFSAIGKVIFSSRGTQISHSGFHKPYREAQSGVRDGSRRACVGILSQFVVPSTAGSLHLDFLHSHCYSRAVRVPVGVLHYLNFLPCMVGVHYCFRRALWVVKLDWTNLMGAEVWNDTSRGLKGSLEFKVVSSCNKHIETFW